MVSELPANSRYQALSSSEERPGIEAKNEAKKRHA